MMMMIYNFSLASMPSRFVFLIRTKKNKLYLQLLFPNSGKLNCCRKSNRRRRHTGRKSGVVNKLLSSISKIVSNAAMALAKKSFHMNPLTFCWLVVRSTSIYFCLVFDFAFIVSRARYMTNSLKSGRKTIASSDTTIFLCCLFCKMPFAKPLIFSLLDMMIVLIFQGNKDSLFFSQFSYASLIFHEIVDDHHHNHIVDLVSVWLIFYYLLVFVMCNKKEEKKECALIKRLPP